MNYKIKNNFLEIVFKEHKSKDSSNILIAGDWAPVMDTFSEKISPELIFNGVLDRFQNSDFNILNLESVFCNEGKRIPKDGPHLYCDVKKIDLLNQIDINLACLANNHVMDYGQEGLGKTISLLNENNIAYTGIMKNNSAIEPFTHTLRGNKIAIINAAEGEFSNPSFNNGIGANILDTQLIVKTIKDLKAENYLVIGYFHAGKEYEPFPLIYLRENYKKFVDAGIDIVIGTHPHVVQGVEIYNDRPIIYSLGNFMFFNKNTMEQTKEAIIVNLKIIDNQINSIEVIPINITQNAISLLYDGKFDTFINRFNSLSEHLNSKDIHDYWDYAALKFDLLKRIKSFSNSKKDRLKLYNMLQHPSHREFINHSSFVSIYDKKKPTPVWVKNIYREYRYKLPFTKRIINKTNAILRK